jgi:hypothetical protein
VKFLVSFSISCEEHVGQLAGGISFCVSFQKWPPLCLALTHPVDRSKWPTAGDSDSHAHIHYL